MISAMARMASCARPLVGLLRNTATRPQYCSCINFRILASRVAASSRNYEHGRSEGGLSTHPVRLFMKASKKRQERFKLKDNIPDGYEIIYRAPLERYLQVGQVISYLSAVVLGAVPAYSMFAYGSLLELPLYIIKTEEINFIQLAVMFGFFVGVNSMFQRVVVSYPFRIYKKNEAYIMVKSSWFPFQARQVTFSKGDFKTGGSQLFSILWNDAVFLCSGKTVIVLLEHFRTPQEFQDMFD